MANIEQHQIVARNSNDSVRLAIVSREGKYDYRIHIEESDATDKILNHYRLGLILGDTIKNCPDDDLGKLAHNKTLNEIFETYKLKNFTTSLYFLIRHLKLTHHIEAGLCETIQIFMAERYYAIWLILQWSFKDIKKSISRCPNTVIELFALIVSEELNYSFEHLLINDRVEFNRTKSLNKFIAIEQIYKNNEELPDNFTSISPKFIWDDILSLINNSEKIQLKLRKKPVFRANLEEYNMKCRYLFEAYAELLGKRTKDGFLIPSSVFDGEMFQTIPNGRSQTRKKK